MFRVLLNHDFAQLWLFHIALWLRFSFGIAFPEHSTYPYMDQYEKNLTSIVHNCPDFVCNLSTISNSEIDMILKFENEKRQDYAKSNQVSNLYKVHWNNELAKFARLKAQRCLPSTFQNDDEQYLIFDHTSFVEIFGQEYQQFNQYPITLQVVIGTREINVGESKVSSQILFKAKMIDYYISLFYSKKTDFELRGGTTLIGCGYIFRETSNSYIDHLVCVYGLLYTGSEKYLMEFIAQCTNCNFYKNKFSGLLPINRSSEWYCDLMYPPLCSDLKSVSVDFHDSSSYDCNTLVSEKMELEENDEHKHPYRSTTTAVPCWYIVAPLLLIIFIILGICLFHSITAGITYYKIKKKSKAAK